MAKVTDSVLDPYFVGKDAYGYTVYEVVTPQKRYLEEGSEGKDYEKPLGHYSSFGASLQKIATLKLNSEKDHYKSIREYLERWDKILTELKILQNYKGL
tara:strand:- start:2194 stop:2490 length:297 start_codon:yes stop_codon:yes gene_type:complete